MRALQAIRKTKKTIQAGPWKTGKMPAGAFPLSKSRSYRLGSTWQWCVWELQCDEGTHYRLLIAFDAGKLQYQAWLGLVEGLDQALLGRLEYHPTHKGWHIHLKSGPLSEVTRGVVKAPLSRDKSRNCATSDSFRISQLDAITVALKVFNVAPPDLEWGVA